MPALLPVILVVSHITMADRVPHFDIGPICNAVPANRSACRRDEQAARRKLHQDWNHFTHAQRARCVQSSSLGGAPSYVELLTCLQIAKEAADLPKHNRPDGIPAPDARRP